MSRRRWQRSLVAYTIVLGLSGTAHADPVDAEKRAAAQALFDAARQLTSQDKWADACPKLLESYRLDPAIGTKFYLAECYEHVGRLASAWTYYLEVVDEAQKEGSKDREKFASQRADALKPRLPRIVVKRTAGARGVAGLVVQRDGVPVGEGMWDTPVPVDLGSHTVRATAPGRRVMEQHVDAKEGAEVVVEIPALAVIPALPPVEEPAPTPPPDVEPPPPSPAQRIAGFVIGGVGLAALAGGAGAGATAISKKNASNTPGNCDASDVCTMAGQKLRSDAITAATASTALIVVGGAALVTGIVLVATAPSKKKPSAGLVLGPFGGRVRVRF